MTMGENAWLIVKPLYKRSQCVCWVYSWKVWWKEKVWRGL